jgi:hypothetical protein
MSTPPSAGGAAPAAVLPTGTGPTTPSGQAGANTLLLAARLGWTADAQQPQGATPSAVLGIGATGPGGTPPAAPGSTQAPPVTNLDLFFAVLGRTKDKKDVTGLTSTDGA